LRLLLDQGSEVTLGVRAVLDVVHVAKDVRGGSARRRPDRMEKGGERCFDPGTKTIRRRMRRLLGRC